MDKPLLWEWVCAGCSLTWLEEGSTDELPTDHTCPKCGGTNTSFNPMQCRKCGVRTTDVLGDQYLCVDCLGYELRKFRGLAYLKSRRSTSMVDMECRLVECTVCGEGVYVRPGTWDGHFVCDECSCSPVHPTRNTKEVSALKQLVKEMGVREFLDSLAAVLERPLHNNFEEGFRPCKGVTLSDFIGEHVIPPGCDHPRYLRSEDGEIRMVYHPYALPDMYELALFCARWGLRFHVSPVSWYYFGRTFAITLYAPKKRD